MPYLYLVLSVFLLAGCTGAPDPETVGPTSSQPVFFEQPKNNSVEDSNRPIEVRLQLAPSYSFTSVKLIVNDRLVRMVEGDGGLWHASPLDDALLTFPPGEHALSAIAETEDGETFTRTITVYAGINGPQAPIAPSDTTITEVSFVSVDSDQVYARFDPFAQSEVPEIPIEEFSEGIEVKVSYEGDIYSMLFRGNALEERVFLHAMDVFNITLDSMNVDYRYGEYSLVVEPRGSVNGDEIYYRGANVQFRVLDSQLKVKTRSIDLAQALNSVEIPEASIQVENWGNRAGEFEISDVPDWLTLSAANGSVPAGETITIEASAPPCADALSALQDTARITVTANEVDTDIVVTRECVDGTLFDLSLDRFYFNQSVPANDSSVPSEDFVELVTNRAGIARAFVTSSDDQDFRMPVVSLVYRTVTGLEGSYPLSGPLTVPENIYEGLLDHTFNTDLPASFFAPGTEFYVVVDPDDEIAERFEDNNRYPKEGYMPLTIRDAPTLKVTFVPMVRSGSAGLVGLSEESLDALFQTTMALMPLSDYDIHIREQPFVFSRGTWGGALSELDALRQADNAEGIYYGLVQDGSFGDSDTAGRANIGGKAALSVALPSMIAHELGHNFGLRHANCGDPILPDPNYPYENAQTNVWGYNIFSGILKQPNRPDFMSYCVPSWISDYHYKKILSNRGGPVFPVAEVEGVSFKTAAYQTDVEQEVLIIGGVISESVAEIHHAFRSVAVVTTGITGNSYTLSLLNAEGNEIYHSVLSLKEVSHAQEKLFTVEIPTSQLNNDIARVIIKKKNDIYLDQIWQSQKWLPQTEPHFAAQLTRIDANKVRINWQADGTTSLWVRDLQTGNVLSIDKTGDVIVFSGHDAFELKYTSKGQEVIEVINL